MRQGIQIKVLKWNSSGYAPLTGDTYPFESDNEHKATIVEFNFEDSTGLALTDTMKIANVKLSPLDKDGVDALDRADA